MSEDLRVPNVQLVQEKWVSWCKLFVYFLGVFMLGLISTDQLQTQWTDLDARPSTLYMQFPHVYTY